MWLKLDIDGILFHFRISGYRKSTEEWDGEWSKEDLALQSKEWLNYQITNDELLLMCEVEELKAKIEALLTDAIESVETMECIEPDLTFIFHPKCDLRNDPKYTYVAPGHEIVDIDMELSIAFWNEGLTSNRLIMTIERSDLEKLLCYLKLIMGTINETDKTVQALISDGTIYGELGGQKI